MAAIALMSVAAASVIGGNATAGTPGTGGNQSGSSIIVSKTTGLSDGEIVQVSGAGFLPSSPLTIWMCDDNATDGTHCMLTDSFNTTTGVDGTFGPLDFAVQSPVVTQGGATVPCDGTGNCSVAATNNVSLQNPGAWVFVGFGGSGSTTPTTGATTSTTSGGTTSTTHATTSTTSPATTTTTSSATTTTASTTSTTAASTTTTTRGATTTTTTTGSTAPSDQGSITVTPGQRTTISGGGFAPNQTVGGTFNSTPTSLGTTTSDGTGHYSAAITIPSDAAPGQHTIVFSGPRAGGGTLDSVTNVTVQSSASPAASGVLSLTGIRGLRLLIAAVLLIVAGLALWFSPQTAHALRRRR